MKLVPVFAGVNDLVYHEIVDDFPITDIVGRTKDGRGLVRMLSPFNEGNFYLSIQGFFPEFNPIVSVAKKSSDYKVLEKITPLGFKKRTLNLIHSDGEIRLENSLRITSLPGVLNYEPIVNVRVNFTYFADTETGRVNFLKNLRENLPNAGYSLTPESYKDALIQVSSGRRFLSEDCVDYRFRGHIDETNPFKLMKFLGEYSPCRLSVSPIELTGFNNRKIGSFNLSR